MPTPTFAEVAELRSIHSLPNRRSGVVLGLTNVRGELLVCVSLGTVLGLDTPESNRDRQRIAQRRLLVIGGDGERMAFPVDEVHGIHRIDLHDLKEVPGTVARATAPYSKAIFAWQQNTVGLLNERLLLHTLSRSLG
ncbi:chemotaxis protein CheW [Roseateles sp.]|uniref:chemotaxis protein CheW n=1 Tax=Roseateles sp. TaxID=1971397 RepID=UPI0032651C9B